VNRPYILPELRLVAEWSLSYTQSQLRQLHVDGDHTELLYNWEKNIRYFGTGHSRSGRVKEEENLWLCRAANSGSSIAIRAAYRGADTSLARPRSKHARKHFREARDFNDIKMRAVFFHARQGAEGNSHHFDRNIILKIRILFVFENFTDKRATISRPA